MLKLKSVSKPVAIRLFKQLHLWRKTEIQRSRDCGFGIDFKRWNEPYYQHVIFKSCAVRIRSENVSKKQLVENYINYLENNCIDW